VIVRRERPVDHDAVRMLHRAAFRTDPVTGATRAPDDVPEARLTDQLREDAGFLAHLSLVAVEDDVVVGHVIGTRGWLEPLGVPAVGIGPVGVLPAAQGRGTGTVLVHALLAVAEAAGERLVVLLGSPDYYRRFGFVASTEVGVGAPDASWGRHFMARWLAEPRSPGTFRYAEPFDRL
jgi:predicted N-acetyltransferase YhbS